MSGWSVSCLTLQDDEAKFGEGREKWFGWSLACPICNENQGIA